MTAPSFLPAHYLNLASKVLGLENGYTISIARVCDLCDKGLIPVDEGAILCHATYCHGLGAHHYVDD